MAAKKIDHTATAQAVVKSLTPSVRDLVEVEDKGGMTNLRAAGRIVAACRGGGQVRVFLRLPEHADAVKAGVTAQRRP